MNLLATGAIALSIAWTAPADTVPLYDNLGDHHYTITTDNPMVQRYFDQGLRLYYAFNHAEAIRAFREAARLDPGCAMCYWGESVSLGPNINMPMAPEAGAAAFAAIEKALEAAPGVSEREQALIRATAARYSADPDAPRAALDSAYAHALRDVVRAHPDDLEVATLFAESMMTLRPWSYWTREGTPEPGTDEILRHLDRVIDANANHPGACHFYIHAVEAVDPQSAVPCAERLAALMPGAGHLVHMPGHIYIRVGRYMDAIRANEHAVHADESYIQDQRPGLGIYTAGYYPHNYDFMAFAASMAGRRAMALDAADKVAELVPDELLGEPGMTALEQFVVRGLQMRVRFERWNEILDFAPPAENLLHARGIWHYARGRALAALGNLPASQAELRQLEAISGNPALDGIRLDFNSSQTILAIARDVLAGSIAAEQGRHDEAVRHLRAAAAAEDALVYGEPPEWSIPVRHDLGAVLLAAGRAADAEVVFREDLVRFPENGWSLHGLAGALEAQGRADEAAEVQAQFRTAWAGSDVELRTAGF